MKRFGSISVSFFLLLASISQALGTSLIEFQARDDVRRPVWRGTVTIAVSGSLSETAPNIAKGSDVAGAIERSVQAWRNVTGFEIKLVETSRQDVSAAGPSGDGVSLLTIAPTAANTLFFSRSDQSPAKTRVFFSRRNLITEADIVLNPAVQFSTDGTFGTFDLESVLTHEIGHLLGLRHSFVPGSMMYDSIVRNGALPRSAALTSISSSDIAELRTLYGDKSDIEDCCGEIVGRMPTNVRKDTTFEVWAQNTLTGEVAAATTVTRGRSFRLGGLDQGTYSIFSQAFSGDRSYEVRELGTVDLEQSSRSSIQIESSVGKQVDRILAIGMNGILADRFLSVQAGTEVQIMVAVEPGRTLPVSFEVNSPFIFVDPTRVTAIDHADGLRAFLINIRVDEAAAKGNHTICSVDSDGARSCVAGALNIR